MPKLSVKESPPAFKAKMTSPRPNAVFNLFKNNHKTTIFISLKKRSLGKTFIFVYISNSLVNAN